jgi:hypothetical protein
VRKVKYSKPICIIYNPKAGSQKNVLPMIEERLIMEKISFESYITEKAFDTFMLANTLDLT